MAGRFRKLGMEQMEERQMMAANAMGGGTQATAPAKLDVVPVHVAANLGAQVANSPTLTINQGSTNPAKELSPDQVRTLDQALGSLDAVAKLADSLARMDQAAVADQLKGLTDALRQAGISEDMIDRLFGAAAAVGSGAGLGQGASGIDPLGLSDHPGWSAGLDLASFRSGADAESGITGSYYDSPVTNVDYDQNGVIIVRLENGKRMVLLEDNASKTEGSRGLPLAFDGESEPGTELITVIATDSQGNEVQVTIDPNALHKPAEVSTTKENEEADEKRKEQEKADAAEEEKNRKAAEELRKKAAEELDKKKTGDPKKNPNPYAEGRGPLPTSGQVQATLTGGVTDPADEFSARDSDVARFVRSLIGFLQSKGNPNPNGPTIDLGGGTVPFTPPGGVLPDPGYDTPKHPVMAPKPKTGPNPVPPLPPGARNEAFAALAYASVAANGVGTGTIMADQRTSTQSVTGLKPASIAGK